MYSYSIKELFEAFALFAASELPQFLIALQS